MKDKLILKVNDFVRYVVTARTHYRSGLYSDTAMNCRKACEAACKVILYHKFSEKAADNKIGDNSLKDLIMILIREGLAERKAINWLESLQIIGNKASHDNEISKEEGLYALNALNLLAEWLFKEHLKISYPKALQIQDSEKPTEAPDKTEKIILQETIIQEKISNEIEEELKRKLYDFDSEKERLLSEHKTSIEELKTALNQTQDDIKRLNRPEVSQPKKSTRVAIAASIVLLLLVTSLSYFIIKMNKETPEQIILSKHPDSIYIGINRISILQDNPNIDFKIEDFITGKLKEFQYAGLPFSIRQLNFIQAGFTTDSLIALERRSGFDYIFAGELYETALKDSNRLNLSLYTRGNAPLNCQISFKSLADEGFVKSLVETSNSLFLTYAKANLNGYKNKKIEGLLKSTLFYSTEQKKIASYYLARFAATDKDYSSSLKLAAELISANKNAAVFYILKADVLAQQNLNDSAEYYYRKGYLLDSSQVYPLYNLAAIYYNTSNKPSFENVFTKIRLRAPENDTTNYWNAQYAFSVNNYQLAKHYALLEHKKNHCVFNTDFLLAELYGYWQNNRDSAEYFYLHCSPDSSDPAVCNRLAGYYLKFYPSEKERIAILLKKGDKTREEKKQKDMISRNFALGMDAFYKSDFKATIKYFEPLFEQNFRPNELLLSLADSYLYLGNSDKALFYSKEALKQDSGFQGNNLNYATILTLTHPEKVSETYRYFKKALSLEENERTINAFLAFLERSNYKTAKQEALEIYTRHPRNFAVNMFLSEIYGRSKDFKSARTHLEFLNLIEPNNDTVKIKLAQCLLVTTSMKDEAFLKGARMIKEAVENLPSNAVANIVMALYMCRGHNREMTRKYYSIARSLDPNLRDPGVEKFINEGL